MRLVAVAALAVGAALFAPGCLWEESEQATFDSNDEDEVFSLTVVELRPDGRHLVTQSSISLSEQIKLRELEAQGALDERLGEARDALAIDSGCATTSLRIWNQENYVGNQICFSGTGVADLANLQYCVLGHCTEWEGHLVSFKTGDKNFHSSDWGTSCAPYCTDIACCQSCTPRNANSNVSPASGCETDARYVDRGGCAPC